MDDKLSVWFLTATNCAGILVILALRHGWRNEWLMTLLLVIGFFLGSTVAMFLERTSWYNEQRNLTTRYRKVIVGSLLVIALILPGIIRVMVGGDVD